MNIKFLALILVSVCVIMSGGCNDSHSDLGVYVGEDINSTWSGAWLSSSGSASVSAESLDVPLTVQNIALILEDCDVEDETGSAKMTALVILSGDLYLPMFFRDLTLTTTRTDINSWTASTPHGNLSVTLLSGDIADFSGEINYLGYDCKFKSSVNKTEGRASTLRLSEFLDGTWKYNALQAGGYRYSNGEMSAIFPREITMCFNQTTSTSTIATTAGLVEIPAFIGESYDADDSLYLQFVNTEEPCGLENKYWNIYELTNQENSAGISTMLFARSENELYMLMNWTRPDGVLTVLFPLEKVREDEEYDIKEAFSKKWSAISGGGIATPSTNTSARVTLEFASCDLAFSDVNITGSSGSAKFSAEGSLISSTGIISIDDYQNIAVSLDEMGINLWRAVSENGSKCYFWLRSDEQSVAIMDIKLAGVEQCILTSVLEALE